jgi:glycosyltransferase involved in cell wall biosynthesis
VRKVLLVIGDLDYNGNARQLTLLARACTPLGRFAVRVIVLGGESPWVNELRSAGVNVLVLGWKRPIDPRPILALGQRLREFDPDVVHAWGRPAVRACVLLGLRGPARLIVSGALAPGRPAPLDGWLLRRAGRVVALGAAEAVRYRRLGVRQERLVVVPPAVEAVAQEPPARLPGLPAGARVLLFVGPVVRQRGVLEAVWALGILRVVHDDLRLVVVGAGPDLERLRRFAGLTGVGGLVHTTGPQPDLAPWLARAEVVLVPSLSGEGRSTALLAMSAGKPVVASRVPQLAELITHGQTGLLAAPGDKADLARQVRLLLDDGALAGRLGAAARQHAQAFTPAALAEGLASCYEVPPVGVDWSFPAARNQEWQKS